MRIFLGYDPAEHEAYEVARFSFERHAFDPIHVSPLCLEDLRRAKVYTRPTVSRFGQLWDIHSSAPMSTEFAISRFFIPHIADTDDKWILFADCDVVCLVNPQELFDQVDDRYALMCVKHDWDLTGKANETKKINKTQTWYAKKNWSSVVLWNVHHPAHWDLTLDLLNTAPGRDLHAFKWLDSSLIGPLVPCWNWLVGVQPPPNGGPKIAHFTLGGPWLPKWSPSPYDDIWLRERQRLDSERMVYAIEQQKRVADRL